MSDLKTNLFYYATKELSQDAFICWLCSYALEDADQTDTDLVSTSRELIRIFLQKGINDTINGDQVRLLKVERQVKNIDVLLTVEYQGKIYKIVVEDKVHSSEHDDQLNRYKDIFKDEDVSFIGIYFKTGFQSDLSNVISAGYALFNREDIINLLNGCKSQNAIINDYRAYWQNFEEIAQSYRTLPINEWPDWQAVNGFYDYMQSVITQKGSRWAGYGYVSNRSGGFWGFWYGTDNDAIIDNSFKAALYLQVETKWNYDSDRYEYKICLKLENQSSKEEDEKYNRIKMIICDHLSEYGFKKPSTMRTGTHMTLGLYSDIDDQAKSDKLKGIMEDAVDNYEKMLKAVIETYQTSDV